MYKSFFNGEKILKYKEHRESPYDRDVAYLCDDNQDYFCIVMREDKSEYCMNKDKYNYHDNKRHYSKPYSYNAKIFRYNFTDAILEMIEKPTEDMLKDNKEWREKYNEDLWEITSDGWYVSNTIGFSRDGWKSGLGVRNEYLSEWICELEEETYWLVKDAEREFATFK